jgi:hypothetical protein
MKRSEAKGFGLQPRGALQQGNISKDDRDWETTQNIEFGRIWLDCLLRKENYFCLISDGRLRSNHGSSSSYNCEAYFYICLNPEIKNSR